MQIDNLNKNENNNAKEYSIWNLGARVREYVDGHFLRDDPQPSTVVHGHDAWCKCINGRRD